MSRSLRIGSARLLLVVSVCLLTSAALSLAGCGGFDLQYTRSPTVSPAPKLTDAVTLPPPPTGTATPLPTNTPTPIPTDTPTPTPTPLHPMSVAYMRQQSYPGSDIVIEETLSPGENYDRYVVSYQSEALKIFGLLTVPQGEPPQSGWPIIVFNHGYIPPDEYRTTERYVAYQDAFARNGYIVFKPDYRGHGDSEGDASSGSRGPGYTIDVLNAVASLQRYPGADPERVGMWGHSMGGSITMRAMVVTDDIKAGVIWAGVVATYEEIFEARPRWVGARPTSTPGPEGTLAPTPEPEGLFASGMFDENPEFWAAIDPLSYLSDLSGPVQLHHATGDESVPVEFSESVYSRLQEAGQTAELYIYEGDNHDISANFATAARRSVAFFDQYVKGSGVE
ncbi:MAG: alpha/beta fold hydrolase [Chloroflexota bacterium]|nr:alpha/beta fold hydrolase [Chloroflexota bacterium]